MALLWHLAIRNATYNTPFRGMHKVSKLESEAESLSRTKNFSLSSQIYQTLQIDVPLLIATTEYPILAV